MRPTPRPPRPPPPGEGDEAEGELELTLFVSCQGGVSNVPLRTDKPSVIGRDVTSDIVIPDESVSRKHAVIVPGNPPRLEDLGSTNGTFLLGREIESNVSHDFPVGSVAQIGMATVALQRMRSPSSALGELPTAPPPPPTMQIDGERVVVDPMMQSLYRALATVGPTTLSVLILGETGTGKEVFAEAVHQRSRRESRPFLKLNCGALPESILESELFGHERGAFTGAVTSKPGLFEAADGGTVFLDEVGELTRATQVKLLRVLETGEVIRIGSVKPKKVDVRLVSATNRNLNQLVASSEFRMDLLFRINGFTVTLPPLRSRPADIPALARHFAARAAMRGGMRTLEFTKAALDALAQYPWPGNIRELRNVIDRSIALCPPEAVVIDVGELLLPTLEESLVAAPVPVFSDSPMADSAMMESVRLRPMKVDVSAAFAREELTQPTLRERLQIFEREQIEQALETSGGHQGRAAQLLGISRRTLFNKMEQLGIRRPRGDGEPPSSRGDP